MLLLLNEVFGQTIQIIYELGTTLSLNWLRSKWKVENNFVEKLEMLSWKSFCWKIVIFILVYILKHPEYFFKFIYVYFHITVL